MAKAVRTRMKEMAAIQRVSGARTILATPLILDGVAVGASVIRRSRVRPFSARQISLLKTFADQAALAIENARLFNELQARTAELTRSVGELKALGEVGQAVSSTLDLETVLRTIVSRAVQLSGLDGGSIYEYDEAAEEFTLRAAQDLDDDFIQERRATRLRRGEGAIGRMAVTRQPVLFLETFGVAEVVEDIAAVIRTLAATRETVEGADWLASR
jgi:GAF domain-containing protein